jgi:hypothetical protein
MSKSSTTKYQVILHEEDGTPPRPIGVVEIGPDHRLAVISTVPDRSEFLRDLAERTNDLAVLHVDVAPPPGARRGALFSKPLARHEGGFREALLERLRRYYDLELKPV